MALAVELNVCLRGKDDEKGSYLSLISQFSRLSTVAKAL